MMRHNKFGSDEEIDVLEDKYLSAVGEGETKHVIRKSHYQWFEIDVCRRISFNKKLEIINKKFMRS
jgi:hypothetical protein